MPAVRRPLLTCLTFLIIAIGGVELQAQERLMQPADLFNYERVGTIVWSPDRSTAAIEIHRASSWLDPRIPTADIAVLDVASRTLRIVSRASPDIVGFFRPAWSPDGRRLLFLSVHRDAIVRPWLWDYDSEAVVLRDDFELHDGVQDPPVALWQDAEHVVLLLRDTNRPNDGPMYSAIQRGRNVADQWSRAREGREAAVTVLDSWGSTARRNVTDGDVQRQIVAVNVRTLAVTTIATGPLHRATFAADGSTLTYWRENPPLMEAAVATFFGPEAQGDAAYDRVNWGSEVHHVDLRTGATVSAPQTENTAPTPESQPTLRVTSSAAEGTRLLLDSRGQDEIEVWRGNGWIRDVKSGRAEAIPYSSANGAPLTGWILYPPDHVAGSSIPIITVVYPGALHGGRAPRDFDLMRPQFLHPQLFAALGFGVALPSIPEAEQPLQGNALAELAAGVLPLLDTLIARGIADPARIALYGQSAGGWATLGLITQTNRFRTAIASASYSNLVSLYGTFYGQFRYGDEGDPRQAQLLRMLQFERGYYGAGAPPWEAPERYRVNSPLWRVADVHTPLMLIHGEADFIPIQQAEEFFTALYRRDQRVRLVRYAGERHTIAARENVLDLWRRLDDWLRETMPVPE